MKVYEKLVAINDDRVKEGLQQQVLDKSSRYYGGIIDPANGIAWPSHGGTPMVMALWATALINPDSSYFHDHELLSRLELSSQYMLLQQHADGTISPGWTNMHSPPDTAFVVGGLAQVYELLVAHDWEPLQDAARSIRLFLERTIPALLTGGCHTPNHRWVMTAALGFMYRLTNRPELKERAMEWLAEGMDCTEDGEWTERSNGIYNTVSDIVLYFTAELFELDGLLETVRRNLRMMAYMIHPDGEIVTDYSGRQDFGSSFDMGGYFLVCKLLAEKDADPLFASMAELAGAALQHPGWLPNNALVGYLRYPQLRESKVKPGGLPERFKIIINRDFPREHYLRAMGNAGHNGKIYHSRLHTEFGAPVARLRDGMTSMTVMAETNSFFALRHGKVRLLAVQIGTAFEPGFVKMGRMEQLDNGYRLDAVESKGYYGPVPSAQLPLSANESVSPWYLLPHHLREMTHEQQHHVGVQLLESEHGWKLRVHCEQPEGLMTQISFTFGAEATLFGADLSPVTGSTMLWKSGTVRCEAGDDWLELDGGAYEHWASELRNTSFPHDCQTLLVNLMTPYDHIFDIRLSPQAEAEG